MADSMEAALEVAAPVSKYEAMLLEKGGPGPTEDKMVLVFQTLDKLVPNLGVFTKVMELCRAELFDAVYSNQYTAKTAESEQTSQYIQRVPFFTLVKHVYDERDERSENLSQQLETVKESLFNKQRQFEDLQETAAEQADEICRLGNKIASMQQDLDAKKNDLAELRSTLETEKQNSQDIEYQLSCDIAELKESLHDAQTDASFLAQYKSGYNDLEYAFTDRAVGTDDLQPVVPKKKKRASIATRRANIISSIENSMKLEEQILTVQNATIEEFDNYIESHKSELTEGMVVLEGAVSVSEDEALTYEQREQRIEEADHQLQAREEQFKRSIDEMNTELDLLRQHKLGLQEQLQQLEQNKPMLMKRKKGRHAGSGRPHTQESGLSGGVDEESEEDAGGMDPFIPQERIFSKYAAMVYTSDNNGRTFNEFKDAKYCPSCLEKTVLCPHKILDQEHVFELPANCTHFKVSRPKVRINQDIIDSVLGQPTGAGDFATDAGTISSDGRRIRSRVSISYQLTPYIPSQSPGDSVISDGSGDSEVSHYKHSLQRLWQDYRERTRLQRQVARPLSMVRCISLIEQFAAYLLGSDEDPRRDSSVCSVLDSVYKFLAERYMKPDVMYLAGFDLITAVLEYSPTNKLIWLFGQVLIGNLDGAVFRYLLLLGDFITEVEWKQVKDVRAFTAIIYPFLGEDDLENLQMGYTSFSENKISSTLVLEYFIYLIMKYREPRFLDMENRLLNAVGGDADNFTEQEYLDATDTILDVPNQKLRLRLYEEARVYVRQKEEVEDGVPVARLAQITSYLSLLSVMSVIKESVVAEVTQARDRRGSDASHLARFKTSHEVPAQYKVTTLTEVKQLADNIARRAQARKARLMAEYMQ